MLQVAPPPCPTSAAVDQRRRRARMVIDADVFGLPSPRVSTGEAAAVINLAQLKLHRGTKQSFLLRPDGSRMKAYQHKTLHPVELQHSVLFYTELTMYRNFPNKNNAYYLLNFK